MQFDLTTVLVFVLALAGMAQQPTAATQSGMASFSGIIIKDPSGEPLKKVSVQAISEDQQDVNYAAVSDGEGHFTIDNVRPGRYRLFLEKTGFFEVSHQRRHSAGQTISLSASQQVKDLVLHMLAAAAITGRVVDEDGDPMANVGVAVLRYSYVNGRRQLNPERSDRTNDVGEYRMGGLEPDRYFLSATPAPSFASLGQKEPDDPAKRDLGYVPIFYPGVTDISQAAALEVHAGDETPVDFTLMPTHTFHIRGRAANLPKEAGVQGGAVTGQVMLMSQGMGTIFSAAEVDKEGKFDIHGVASGSYLLTFTTPDPNTSFMGRQTVVVTNADVNDVRLEAAPPGNIRGHLHFAEPGKFDFSQVTVFLQPAEDDPAGAGSYDLGIQNFSRVQQDGSFELKSVPAGNYRLEVQGTTRDSRDFYLQKVIAAGQDVSDASLRMAGSGTLNVEIILSAGTAVVQGTVLDKKNDPVKQAIVVALPQSEKRARHDLYQVGEADQYGRFTLRGLRPGQYTLLAWDYVEDGAYFDPEFVKPYERAGRIVEAAAKQTQQVSLQVLAGSTSGSAQ